MRLVRQLCWLLTAALPAVTLACGLEDGGVVTVDDIEHGKQLQLADGHEGVFAGVRRAVAVGRQREGVWRPGLGDGDAHLQHHGHWQQHGRHRSADRLSTQQVR